mgnify:CR=1 FL=1
MNKINFFIFLIISFFFHNSGLTAQRITKGDIYALVIGVSEYSDSKITQLNYAHKDAKEFANYLMSEAGGKVPADNIKLLTNKDATVSKIYNAKKWLEETPKKGDLVFFYFAGHGDVESSLYKLGFLLAHDTPHKNYLNNAIRIEDFNIMANTLSVEKEIDVILITDACHSGKLAGSDNRGRLLIGEQLSRSQKNEIRIASCESDQLAQENLVWGGGRGAFSYHLVNGLKGLADGPDEKDGVVTLFELKNYLEKLVPKEVFEETGEDQIPVVDGRSFSRMAIVHGPTLDKLINQGNNSQSISTAGAASRSLEWLPTFADSFFMRISDYDLEENIDFNSLAMRPHAIREGIDTINSAVLSLDLVSDSVFPNDNQKEREDIPLTTEQITKVENQIINAFVEKYSVANDSLKHAEWLEKIEVPSRERTEFLRGIAARIHDYIQGAVNRYLVGDNEEMDKRQYMNLNGLPYEKYPDMLTTAMRLIDTSNHLYHIMKVKKHYFQGVNYRLGYLSPNRIENGNYIENALYHQQKALGLDSNAAYVQNELGIISKWQKDYSKAESYFSKACALVPTWSIPRSNLSSLYYTEKKYNKGLEEGLKSLSIQSDYANGHINTGKNAMKLNNLLIAKEAFIKAGKLDANNFSPYLNLGELYTSTTDYTSAEVKFEKAVALLKQYPIPGPMLDLSDFDSDGVTDLGGTMANNWYIDFKLNPNKFKKNDHISHFIYALEMYRKGDIELAEKHFRITVTIRGDHPLATYYLGVISYNRQDLDAADAYFQSAYLNYVSEYNLEQFYDEDELAVGIERKDEFLPFFASWHVDKDLILYLRAKVLNEWGYYLSSESMYIELIARHSNLFFLRSELWQIYKQLGYNDKVESTIIASRSIDKYKSDHTLTEFYKELIEKKIDTKANSYKLANHYYYQFLENETISFELNNNSKIWKQESNALLTSNTDGIDDVGMVDNFTVSSEIDELKGLKHLYDYNGFKDIYVIPIKLYKEGRDAIVIYESLFSDRDSTGKGELMYRIGDLHVAMNDHSKALASYEIANDYNKMVHPSIILKSIYINEGFDHYRNSYKSLDKLYRSGLLPALWYRHYTYYLALNQEYATGTKAIDQALKMTPFDNEALRNNQGLVYLRQKDWKQAEALYQKLSEEYPENVGYLYTLARIYAQSGKMKKAFKYLDKGFDQNWNFDYVIYSDPLLTPLKTESKWEKKVLSRIEGEFDLLFR